MRQRLRESLPRAVDFTLWLLLITLCVTPLGIYLRALQHGTASKNSGLLEVVLGLLGIFLLVRQLRLAVLYSLAGRTIVEISPAVVGKALDVRIAQGRGNRRMEATLYCRERRGRRNVVELLKAPLTASVVGRIEGTLLLPKHLPASEPAKVDWQLEVQIHFARGFVLDEDFPLKVTKEGPSTDRSSG